MHQFKDLVKVGFVNITQVPGPPEGRSKNKITLTNGAGEGYQQIGGVGKLQALVPPQKHHKQQQKKLKLSEPTLSELQKTVRGLQQPNNC